MKLTDKERAELKILARATDDKSLDRFCKLLAKEALPDGTCLNAPVLREKMKGYSPATHAKALRESIKKAFPDMTEARLDIFLRGPMGGWDLREADSPDIWSNHIEDLAAAVKELHPELSDDEIAQWVKKNEARALAAKSLSPSSSAAGIVMGLEGEDKENAAAQWLPDGLKKLHPTWSQSQIDLWVKKHEELARSFKGIHPEWDARAVIIATDPAEGERIASI